MCGIAGLIGPQKRDGVQGVSEALLRLLSHRGPDDHGWLLSSPRDFQLGRGVPPSFDAEALLCHRRLSILDLTEAGWQPMGIADGRFFIVFNGEIYNFLELRSELEFLGHVFQSHSDTEVLLHALMEWGTKALPRLIGMFAFALLDRRERRLMLARDFFGIKPLYYAATPLGFAFASEIKALLSLTGLSRRVNPRRLYDYLATGLTDHGRETMFAGIHQLPAAHYLEINLDAVGGSEPVRYWNIDLHDRIDISYPEATAQVRELFLQSVKLHLRSDVPVGAALSGGIDSSSIVGAMRQLEPKLELHAFSYIADTNDLSEEKWVDLAAERAGAVLHKIHTTPDELVEDLEQLVYQQDEPFGSTSIYAQHLVFRRARASGVTVMLDGQGADEMLGGYRTYLAARLASLVRQGHWIRAVQFLKHIRRLPGSGGLVRILLQMIGCLVPAGCKRLGKQLLQKSVVPAWLNAEYFQRHGEVMFNGQWTMHNCPSADLLRQKLHATLMETSLPMLLRYEDRNSMAHSIESRVPFLIPSLAEFLLRLPEEYLIGPDGTSKRIFRDATRGFVPDAILDRKDKIGFATPEQRWLTVLRPWAERILHSDTARDIPAFRSEGLHEEWRQMMEGKRRFDFRAWRWVNLIRWAERFEVAFD
jgi:asparagine synthase (glutamine-hydrolysing)